MTAITIEVNAASASYVVHIEPGLAHRLPEHLEKLPAGSKLGIVTTQPIFDLHGAALQSAMTGAGYDVTLAVIPDGEPFKTLETAASLYTTLIEAGFDRQSTLVSLGGGVVGDLTGFVAATYLRGIGFIQIPTTLLAMVDASVGGKTGVNHPLGKNLIGAFHQPLAVLIDPGFLRTLPARQMRAGLAEMLKMGLIADPDYLDLLLASLADFKEPLDDGPAGSLIATACRLKADIVSADERETNRSTTAGRRLLNFGHTLGHAIEAVAGYGKLLHGEAVALGMVGAAYLSAEIAGLPFDSVARIEAMVAQLKPPGIGSLDPEQLAATIARDKKRLQGTLHWVLLKQIGAPVISGAVQPDTLSAAIDRLQRRFP
ncbi:MAG: 3-dehydroquinate synthase [Candidatus Marinimicrobia bacterium]|nr:3-dehydroquinate synthase [Candidatus Neomarinimicrobiota bacterium]